ncbi:MAG: GNAT family N-acetyltransferase [Deltaproteobacteria bacterium]|nr:MAG: GNAT family N-acetyltransferase [Deltaproteobacteria bacterium]
MKSNHSFKVISRLELGQRNWDAFVDASDEAWLWHRYDLQDAMTTWPGKSDLSFAIIDGNGSGRIVAVIPLHLLSRRVGAWYWNMLESLGGPACPNRLSDKEKRHIKLRACEYIAALAKKHGAVEVKLALAPLSPVLRGDNCPRVNPLLDLGFSNTLTQTFIVDLRQGREKVWLNLEARARTAIRKAEKQGVRVRPAAGIADLEIYYALHKETYRRTNIKPHPKSYFDMIWHNFLEKDGAYILFAECQGRVVAAENFGIYKDAAIYWTGAASQMGLSLSANSLLQWAAMQWMVERGIAWYETGEAYPHLQEGKLKGLSDFKKSFGGKLYPYYQGTIVFRKKMHGFYVFYKTLRDR